ncbi:MAG TPA: PHP domain-containing protein [Elusimicrobiota bacterium]|nr:PHP domain-containing protein [Elusimicrobiota bacterium]
MKVCDLHTHTTFSDGTLSAVDLVRRAKDIGLSAVAITDHDTTDAIDVAQEEGKRLGIEVVPGIELSATVTGDESDTEMHILGYFIRHHDSHFQETLAMFRRTRLRRAHHILNRLSNLGLHLNAEKLYAQNQGKAFGRPHIARALIDEGYVSSYDEAFDIYLSEGKPAYVPKARLTPTACIHLIRRVGGLAVMAHPYFGGPRLKKSWGVLLRAGLNGIEAVHPKHSESIVKAYEKLAKELDLFTTGGSDFHSDDEGPAGQLGDVRMPYSVVETMRKKKESFELKTLSILQEVI